MSRIYTELKEMQVSAGKTPGTSQQLTSVCRQGIARASGQHGEGQLGSLLPVGPPQKPLQQLLKSPLTGTRAAVWVRTKTHA